MPDGQKKSSTVAVRTAGEEKLYIKKEREVNRKGLRQLCDAGQHDCDAGQQEWLKVGKTICDESC